VHTLLQEIRHAGRALAARPGFTSIAVLTLALGIGANTAIFSVIRSVLLRPLPFREPDRLVELWETRLDRGWDHASFTHANVWDVQARNRTLEGVGAMGWTSMNLSGFEYPEQLSAAEVSAGFFRVLGVTPEAGRTFLDEESEPGHDNHVVLLGHRLWASRFGADPAMVGRTLTLDGAGYTVVGVLPPGTPWLDAADVFVPLVHRADANRSSFELAAIGRLKAGVSIDAARADLERVARELAAEYPADDHGMGIGAGPSSGWVASASLRRALWVLMGAVGFLLLIACVNLTNLFLARATGGAREHALRAALGAGRARLVGRALVESCLVGLVGAGLGLALAAGGLRLLRAFDPGDIPRLADVSIDWRVLAFTLAAACVTGLATGLVPALQAPYGDLVPALREGGRGVAGTRGQRRLRAVLVAAEIALALVLLVGAGLLVRSFGAVLGADRGFQTDRRLVAAVSLPPTYDGARAKQFLVDLLARLEASPQVVSAGAVSARPLVGGNTGLGFAAVGAPDVAGQAVPWASWRLVTRDYFQTMGIPLLRGRTFTEQDEIGKPWRVIVSQSVAEMLWPGDDPIGRQIVLWKGQEDRVAEVVGLVGDQRERGLERDPTRAVYLPYYGAARSPIQIVVHTANAPGAAVPLLRSALAAIDPALPLSDVATLDQVVSVSVASRRFVMLLLAAFAAVALLLALAGVYGVLAYSVSRRTTEIGVRVALGASPRGVLWLIVRQGMRPVAVGLGAGVAAAVALAQLMASLLVGVTPEDPATYAGVAAMLAAAAVLACYLPARHALSVDPVAALKQE
jgi:predicted permease